MPDQRLYDLQAGLNQHLRLSLELLRVSELLYAPETAIPQTLRRVTGELENLTGWMAEALAPCTDPRCQVEAHRPGTKGKEIEDRTRVLAGLMGTKRVRDFILEGQPL